MLLNNRKVGHLKTIKGMLSDADEVYIAVAFLKVAGLRPVLPSIEAVLGRKGEVNLIIGLDLYLTDPEALYGLYSLKQEYKGINLYLYKSKNSTFHPKIYFVKNKKTCEVLIGSANLTNGGMNSNTEVSSYSKNDNSLFDQSVEFFVEITTDFECKNASLLRIRRYEEKCTIFREEQDKANKKANNRIGTMQNSSLVIECYKEYRSNRNEMDNLRQKRQNYRDAKILVKKINAKNIKSSSDFIAIYERLVGAAGEGQLWHSGSIFRSKNIVAKSYIEFIKFVSVATDKKTLNKSPEKVFEDIIPFKESIKGLGFNVITELLSTFEPSKFPVLNKNPISSVKYLWGEEFKEPGAFKSSDYKCYSEFMGKLSEETGAEDFLETDHFLNYIYWRYARDKT